jgi:hypothetical protein
LKSEGFSSLSSFVREYLFINSSIEDGRAAGKPGIPRAHTVNYTASLFLPFLLLLLSTFRPAFVLILDKNPKVLFLFVLLG